jgi:hypothetical protein
VLSRSEFKPDGAVLEPVAAQVIPVVTRGAQATYTAGIALYAWATTQNTPNRQAVAEFRAREYSGSPERGMNMTFVGQLTREQAGLACPRLSEVQDRTDDAANAFAGDRASMSPQRYGTAVHTHLKHQIDGLGEENFRAEVSLLKSKEASYYSQRGSIRIDVYENTTTGTICIYDIKTGEADLRSRRILEIMGRAVRAYGVPDRMIITTIRPTR